MTHTLTVHFLKLVQNIQPPEERRKKAVELEPPAADPVGCRLVVPTVDFAPRRSS
ncbi:MAG: hypothetical protein ACRDJW_12385 [Thermomicrobiales bacterium]